MGDGSVSRAVGRCNEGCSVGLGRLGGLGCTLEVVGTQEGLERDSRESRRVQKDWDIRELRDTQDPRQLHELE